jgi:glycerol 2-dehydrogenase (NADP+)
MATYIEVPSFKLNTGASIQGVGFGTWRSTEEEAYSAVIDAIKAGYRHIDTAYIYGNEHIVGKAIKDSGVPREELFVTTKLWATGAQKAQECLERSVKALGLEYVDLYLMHWPVAMNANGNDPNLPSKPDGSRDIIPESEWSYIDTYKSMEKLLDTGLTKAIGVSNFTKEKMEKLLKETTVVPAALQIELHPLLPQQELVDFCHENKILVEAYSPLGSIGAPLLKTEELIKLGEKYKVSTACICISWSVWRGVIPLPKSTKAARIAENFKIVKLSDEDGKTVSELYKTHGVQRFVAPDWGVKIFD